MRLPTIPIGKIADENGNMTEEFKNFVTQLMQILNSNIGQSGVTVQSQTATNITTLIANGSIKDGTIIYDSTNNVFKGFENGTLKTFTLI